MQIEYMDIMDAIGATIPYSSVRIPNYGDSIRFVSDPANSQAMILTYDPVVSVCRWFPAVGGDVIDVCVSGRKLEAAVSCLDKSEALEVLLHEDGLFELRQGDTSTCLETLGSDGFPGNLSMDGMAPIYVGANPIGGIDALKHVSSSNIGTVQIYDVLIFMKDVTYLVGTNSVIRGNFSLVDGSDPRFAVIPVQIRSVLPLAGLGAEITAYADYSRLLVADARGHVLLRQSAVDLKSVPQSVADMYSSLVLLGQVRVDREELIGLLKSAMDILADSDNKHPYLDFTCQDDYILMNGKVGRTAFARKMAANCSKAYKIHVNADRLLAFAKASDDDEILIRVMDSPINKHAMNFVHLVDSKLHEIVAIPMTHPIEEIE